MTNDDYRPRHRMEREPERPALWPQIALGVFLGMLAHSIVVGLYVRYEMYRAGKQVEAVLQDMKRSP